MKRSTCKLLLIFGFIFIVLGIFLSVFSFVYVPNIIGGEISEEGYGTTLSQPFPRLILYFVSFLLFIMGIILITISLSKWGSENLIRKRK